MKHERRLFWVFLLLMVLMIVGYFSIQKSRGLSLKWSSANMRFIWVDKDGNP